LLRSCPNPNSKPCPTPNPKDDEEDMTPLVDLVRKEPPSPGELFPIALFLIVSPTHLTITRTDSSSSGKKAVRPKKTKRPRWVYEPAAETQSPYWDTLGVATATATLQIEGLSCPTLSCYASLVVPVHQTMCWDHRLCSQTGFIPCLCPQTVVPTHQLM
jgi:hypothetical protein